MKSPATSADVAEPGDDTFPDPGCCNRASAFGPVERLRVRLATGVMRAERSALRGIGTMRSSSNIAVPFLIGAFLAVTIGDAVFAQHRHDGASCGAAVVAYDAMPVSSLRDGTVSGEEVTALTIDGLATDCETVCKQEGERVFRRCRMDGKEATLCAALASGAFETCVNSSCSTPTTEPPCSFACRLLGEDAEDECHRPPNPPGKDCREIRDDVFNDCLSSSCGQVAGERPCELHCREVSAESYQVCLDAGEAAETCATRAQETGDRCLTDHCDSPGTDLSCVHGCQQFATQFLQACLAEGGKHGPCARASRDLLGSCLKTNCDAAGANATCAAACHAVARAQFDQCLAAGSEPSFCARATGDSRGACLRSQCDAPPPGSECAGHCDEAADIARKACLADGRPASECVDESNDLRLDCVLNDCPTDAGCGVHCPRVRFADFQHDAVVRRTDPVKPVDVALEPIRMRAIELIDLAMGTFEPFDPRNDRFAGAFDEEGEFLRLDLRVAGVVNPPGRIEPTQYTPFLYGPRPIYGFVEIDMDVNPWTGGETEDPEHRYLANLARFGGNVPDRVWRLRTALSARVLDDDFETGPSYERHGEEFHLAFLGGEATGVVETAGDGDATFEEGESWLLRGAYFHRAHGFEPFSLATGGQTPGRYMPPCDVRFQHNVADDTTQISVVFPLTNLGSALVRGQPPQPPNGNPSDQASIEEGMADLRDSAQFVLEFPTFMPEEALIHGWASQHPASYLDPTAWRVSAILGTVHALPRGEASFIWTDLWPNVLPGDFMGKGSRDESDAEAVVAFVNQFDGKDGVDDGVVPLPNFSRNFSVLDVDYDGAIRWSDAPHINGDVNRDGRVDMLDAAHLQRCFGPSGRHSTCEPSNFDDNDLIDWNDARVFGWLMGGPQP